MDFDKDGNDKYEMDTAEKDPLLSASTEESCSTTPQLQRVVPERSLQVCMVLSCGVVYAARTVIPLVVPEVAAELGWSKVLVGYVLSFFFWGYALTQVLGGRMADRVGGARVIVATQLVGAASLLLFPPLVLLWPPAAVLLRCLLGMVQGPHYPSLSSVSRQLVSAPRRARFFSTSLVGASLGTILVGLVGSALLQSVGWRAVVSLTGVLYASSALWLFSLTRHCPRPGRQPSADRPGGGGAVPWAALLRSRPVWACVLAHMAHATTWFILISWLPSYFKQAHPEVKGWLVNTLPFVCNGAGTLLCVPLAEGLQRRQLSLTSVRKVMEVGSQLAAGAALFILPHVSGSVGSVLLVSVAAFSVALHAGGGILLPNDLCPEHVGSVFGVMNTGGAIAGFVSNLAAGFLLEQYGDFAAVFQMAATLAVAGAAMFAAIGSAERLRL